MTAAEFDSPNDELLFRYVANECSAAERLELERWFHGNLQREQRVDDMRRIRNASGAMPQPDIDRVWTQIRAAVETKRDRRSRRAFQASLWAAGLLLVIGGGVLMRLRVGPFDFQRGTSTPLQYATGPAQSERIQLPDGTRVTLAPMSHLRVGDDFGRRDRTVTLEGQGFFDVAHNPARPFRVRAQGAIAEDVGTRFDVRAYAGDKDVVVIVADGAVAIGRAHEDRATRDAANVIVRSGERARLGEANGPATVEHVSLRLLGWTDGTLAFDGAPLSEIARAIGRWYDLDVRVADSTLARRPVTADFRVASPEEMVATLATAVNAEVVRDGRVLTIRPKR